MLLQIAKFYSSLWLISTWVCVYHIFFIHLSTDGHLGCFYILTVVNSAAIGLYISFWIRTTNILQTPCECLYSQTLTIDWVWYCLMIHLVSVVHISCWFCWILFKHFSSVCLHHQQLVTLNTKPNKIHEQQSTKGTLMVQTFIWVINRILSM